MKEEMFDGFFGGSPEFWIGKVVKIESQRQTAQGFSWGWRYKVRIFGTYSNSDTIQDKDCHTAMVMLGVSDGSGGGGRTRAVRITQHDIVFGLFMAPDQNFPVIMGVLGRTKRTINIGGKFGILSGFTKFLQRGLTENQEFNECDSMSIPKVKDNNTNGTGSGREVNQNQLDQIGQSGDDSQVNAIKNPPGSTEYDTSGLDNTDISNAVQEEKDFINANGGNFEDSTIINETDTTNNTDDALEIF
ncbi:MAG: hypothetical protein CMN34_07265 [Saprospirales bacterium]|nr:hypothetical protein [Saprospirales bacterium]|tara:strand:- start:5340 stop:6074 length:735 start_codon:yes stop_codon:yes gene_type:complete